jgi:hypothetical protein
VGRESGRPESLPATSCHGQSATRSSLSPAPLRRWQPKPSSSACGSVPRCSRRTGKTSSTIRQRSSVATAQAPPRQRSMTRGSRATTNVPPASPPRSWPRGCTADSATSSGLRSARRSTAAGVAGRCSSRACGPEGVAPGPSARLQIPFVWPAPSETKLRSQSRRDTSRQPLSASAVTSAGRTGSAGEGSREGRS